MRAAELWKPTSGEFISNPYPVYRQLRSSGPVFQANSGDYVVTGYRECKQVLQDPLCTTGLRKDWVHKMVDYSSEKKEQLRTLSDVIDGMLIQMNTPPHPVVRSAMAKAWPSPSEISQLASGISKELIRDLSDEFDAMEALCRKLPLFMICDILGLPRDRALTVMNDGLRLVQLLDPYLSFRDLEEISGSASRLEAFISESMEAHGFSSTPLSRAVLSLDPEKIGASSASMLTFLFIAGFETTSTLIASCIHQLIIHKEIYGSIHESGLQSFVREVLRRFSPVQITGRLATREIFLGGQIIPENSVLTLCIGAANVDPSHFDQPERLMLDRKNSHLSFGYGMHHCLGSQLAELEAEALLQDVMNIIPKLELVGEPVLENKLTIRSYQSLPLKFK